MNTIMTTMKRFFLSNIFLSCLFLFLGCGLDEYYVLDAPVSSLSTPSVTSANYTFQTPFDSADFSFRTNEEGINKTYTQADSSFKFLGTAIYYKIYNNYSKMNSEISSLSSLNTSTNESAAASKMIETYKYVQLGCKEGSVTPLISGTGNNKTVKIRLTNYQEFISKIYIDDVAKFTPIRNKDKEPFSFDFGRSNKDGDYSDDELPKDGDSDVVYGDESSEGMWYVSLYAVAVGRDTTYTTYYSGLLHLGAVAIDSREKDN